MWVIGAVTLLGSLAGAVSYWGGDSGSSPAEGRAATSLFDAAPAAKSPQGAVPAFADSQDFDQDVAQDMAERVQADAEQVAEAIGMLDSARDADEKVAAIGQLSAYPTRASEALMVKSLRQGASVEERDAAAQGLGQVEKPKEDTVEALLAALDDDAEEVQSSAAITLQDMADHLKKKSPLRKKIIAGLKEAKAGGRLHDNSRAVVESYLESS